MDWRTEIHDLKNEIRVLNKTIPETTRAFAGLSKAVRENGVLNTREKEFVALGIAVAQGCEDCMGFHVEALMRAGGSREELADVLAMSIQMAGGPALMNAARALACWDQLSKPKE